MPRVKSGVAHHARKKKIMQAAKGARGGRSKLYKAAKETVERGMRYAYRDRRKKKSEFRALEINRKILADLAVRDADAFGKLAEVAKNNQ
jgi:large subunit ribosomal protein L20